MDRYQAEVRDGVYYIESDHGWFEVGSMDVVCDLIGGETYSIQYDERQRQMDWLDTDQGRLTFDVRETLAGMSYDAEFVSNVQDVDLDEEDEDGYPLRASVFADIMINIWDSKGNLE